MLNSTITQSWTSSSALHPKFVYRGCESNVASLEVVKLETESGASYPFLWAGEESGDISIYNLSSQHLSLRFKTLSAASCVLNSPSDPCDLILSIDDLGGGYVMTYSRSAGVQVWFWTFSNAALPSNLKGTKECFVIDPILLIPQAPKLVASYYADNVSFCCPSLLECHHGTQGDSRDFNLKERFKLVALPYGEENLVHIVSISLPPLSSDLVSKELSHEDLECPILKLVSSFRVTSVQNMMMAMKFYSTLSSIKSLENFETFLLIGLEDGSVQWHAILFEQRHDLIQACDHLLWKLPELYGEPTSAIVISEDFTFGFSLSANGALTRFKLDYPKTENFPSFNQNNDKIKCETSILPPPDKKMMTLKSVSTGSGGTTMSVKDGCLAIGHFDNSVGLYSTTELELTRKLSFHKKGINQVLHFNASGCAHKFFSSSGASVFLFASSQDSRISLWKISE